MVRALNRNGARNGRQQINSSILPSYRIGDACLPLRSLLPRISPTIATPPALPRTIWRSCHGLQRGLCSRSKWIPANSADPRSLPTRPLSDSPPPDRERLIKVHQIPGFPTVGPVWTSGTHLQRPPLVHPQSQRVLSQLLQVSIDSASADLGIPGERSDLISC